MPRVFACFQKGSDSNRNSHLFWLNKTEIATENNKAKTKCSSPFLSSPLFSSSTFGIFVSGEILKRSSTPLSSCGVFLLKHTLCGMSLVLQGAHGSLCFQGCLVQKGTMSAYLIPDFIVSPYRPEHLKPTAADLSAIYPRLCRE